MRHTARRLAVLARRMDRARRHDPAPLCVVAGDPAKIATRRALVAAWSQRSGRTAPFLVILDR